MAEVEHWKRMYTESGRDVFLLKYQKIELEKRVNELENQEALRLIDELDLKHLLEDVKIKYDGLLLEFQEKKNECELVKSELKELSESKIGVGNGLKEYQVMCNRWKDRRNKSLEEEKGNCERIISLEKEIMKMGSDHREKCVELSKEIMELECVKRRVEDEIQIWKEGFTNLESRKRRAEDEVEIWKEGFTNLESRKRRAEDECEIWKQKFADSECGKTRVEDKMEIWKKKLTDSECGKRRAEDEMEIWKQKFADSECANRRAEDEIEICKQEVKGLESEKTRAGVEINLLKIKCMELEIQAGEMLNNHGAELEDCKAKCHGLWVELKDKEAEFEDCKTKCHGLWVEVKDKEAELEDCKTKCHGLWVELKDKETVCIDLHHELMVYKTKCNGMEECIMELTESGKDVFAREKAAVERSAYFERCLKKVMSDERELRVQLGKVIENLKCGRKITADENEVLKKKLLGLEEYKLKYHGVCKEIKEKEMECAGVLENLMLAKVALDHELEDYKTKCSAMEDKIMALTKEGKIMSEREKTANEKIACFEELVKKMESDEANLCAQLKSENWVLECGGNRRAEDEIEVLKMNFTILKKELEDYTTKCHGLSTALKVKEMECVGTESQLKELSESKIGLENELKEYEIMCNRLSEQIIKCLEDKRIASERDKEAKERIIKLEEEIKKIGSDQREKCVEFSKEITDLKSANLIAEDEIDIWKKKYMDLDCGKTRADDEIEILKRKCKEIKEKEMECAGVLENLMLTKVALDHELEDCRTKCSGMEEKIMALTKEGKIMSEREKTANEKISYLEEVIKKMKSDEANLCAQLKSDNGVLECGKKRADAENEVLKMNFMKLKKELEDYTSKCHGLSAVPKVKEMDECVDFEFMKGEFKELSGMCKRLKEQIIKSLEDKRIASERDKEAKERIIKLEEEIKKMGSGLREKCVEFNKEIIDLKTAKQRAEEEMEIWKKKYMDLEGEKRRADGEIELVKKKCRELEIQASEMLNHGAELEDYKTKCHGLSTVIKEKEMECADFEGKLKNLVLTKVALERELQDYKTTCSRMKDEITGLTNVGKIMSEREKTSHDRIAYFEELVKKMESDEKNMLIQLKNENMVLKHGRRRAEDETENWKKRFTELEMGVGSLQKEVGYDNICEKYMDEYISRKTDGRVNAASVAHLTKSEKVLSPASLPTTDFSSFHEMLFGDLHVPDTLNTKSQFDHSADFKVEKKNICSDTKVELVSEAKQHPGSETRGSCKENLVLLKQDSVTTSSICIIEIEDDIIEVSDGEDENPLTHTCNNKGEDIDHASTDGTLKTLNKHLKRPLPVWGGLDKNIQFSSTMKRCKVSTSRSVSQEDDKFPNIGI